MILYLLLSHKKGTINKYSPHFVLLIFSICLSGGLFAQNYNWAYKLGGQHIEYANGIVVDANGSVYSTGSFSDYLDFDPSSNIFPLTSTGGSMDVFISKSDASGNFIWARNFGGSGEDKSSSIAVDASGNVYTTGTFHGLADFDPSGGIYYLSASQSYSDNFISKLDVNGNFVWAQSMGATSFDDLGYSIVVDANENVYVAGAMANPSFFGSYDIVISKIDASGNFIWTKNLGSNADDRANSITVDEIGNVYLTGSFSGTVDFDPDTNGIYNLNATGGYTFILKLDMNGNFDWAKSIGGGGGNSIKVDGNGDIYLSGYFGGTADFDPDTSIFNLISSGASDIFVSKYSATGSFIWAKKIGSPNYEFVFGNAIDLNGNIYTTGGFLGICDFDPGPLLYNLTASTTTSDIFISKLDRNGNFVLAKRIGGTSWDEGRSIAVDASENVYLAGTFVGTVDFNFPFSDNLTSVGSSDIFIAKYGTGVGISKLDLENNFTISPNPNHGFFMLSILNSTITDKTIAVTDVLGKTVWVSEHNFANKIPIDLSLKAKGVYFARIVIGQEIFLNKIVIQ